MTADDRPAAGEDAPGAGSRPAGTAHGANAEVLRLKERIYAVITMIAVVVTLTEDDDLNAPDAAWSVCGTAIGIWLATLVADQQAYRVVNKRIARGRDLRTMLWTSSALLLSAVVPLAFTALAGLGVFALPDALLTAALVELGGLFGWGALSGLRMGGGLPLALLAGAADLLAGALIVVVKVTAGH